MQQTVQEASSKIRDGEQLQRQRKLVSAKIIVWFRLYGLNMSLPSSSTQKFTAVGKSVCWRRSESAVVFREILQWSNGHQWRWPYRSFQHISDRCERSMSGRKWFWKTDESQFEIYPLHGNCTLEMFTARLRIREAVLYREDIFEFVSRRDECINPLGDCIEKLWYFMGMTELQ